MAKNHLFWKKIHSFEIENPILEHLVFWKLPLSQNKSIKFQMIWWNIEGHLESNTLYQFKVFVSLL